MRILTPEALRKRKLIIIADLQSKTEAEDWHGVQDCASDIREIDAQLAILAITSAVSAGRKAGETDWEFGETRMHLADESLLTK
jgi:hypothetical protein